MCDSFLLEFISLATTRRHVRLCVWMGLSFFIFLPCRQRGSAMRGNVGACISTSLLMQKDNVSLRILEKLLTYLSNLVCGKLKNRAFVLRWFSNAFHRIYFLSTNNLRYTATLGYFPHLVHLISQYYDKFYTQEEITRINIL